MLKRVMALERSLYCIACGRPTETVDVRAVTTRNGRPATRGRCAICGRAKFQFGRPSWLRDDPPGEGNNPAGPED